MASEPDHTIFAVLLKTGDEELEDRGKPSWERLRMIYAHSTLAWRPMDMEDASETPGNGKTARYE